jgi:hypothetical protein
VTNPKTESDEGTKYVLSFTVAAKPPLLWSLRCTSRVLPMNCPCSRIKIVRYIFTHGLKICLLLYSISEVSCKTQSQMVVRELPTHIINHPPMINATLLL